MVNMNDSVPIKNSIFPDEVIQTFPDNPDIIIRGGGPVTKEEVNISLAVAHLLMNNVLVFTRSNMGSVELIFVSEDTSLVGQLDITLIDLENVPLLYKMWMANPVWGPVMWVIKNKLQSPHPSVVKSMIEHGLDVPALLNASHEYDDFLRILGGTSKT